MKPLTALSALTVLAALGACTDAPASAPPLGEALLIVDTDLPTRLASRLRVDTYTEDGTWYSSRDFQRSLASDWPTSFSVYSPDPDQGRVALVRLRAYPEGKVRDYRGERYAARPPPGSAPEVVARATPPDGEGPRLVADDGSDATPRTEPQPLVTVDRLLSIRVSPGTRGSVRVVLAGACVGTMADVGSRRSCVDAENVLTTVTDAPLQPDLSRPSALAEKAFGEAAPCPVAPRAPHVTGEGTQLFDEDVCVPGGAFVFGAPGEAGFLENDAVPERVAIVPSFLMDRYEVTVGRWRQALREGFAQDKAAIPNEVRLPRFAAGASDIEYCTFSTAPLGRETHPVNCVRWGAARAFCQFYGGDLPTEVQWEYAAAQAGRDRKTAYPWGDATPECDRAVLGRDEPTPGRPLECLSLGLGPQPVDAAAHGPGDVSATLGIADLGGSVREWTRDNFASLGSNCWAGQPLASPHCEIPNATRRAIRGFGWMDPLDYAYVGRRSGGEEGAYQKGTGFRCVRAGGGP